ncbi:MAG: hypothetical protein HOH33_09300 [Verrucomicrobia bacterium]|nr:hypothetical protein [Verrucomicrobiota bacterium]
MNQKTILSYGEALWDLLPNKAILGGAPFNFAYRMHALAHRSRVVSRLGIDDYGLRARDQIAKLGMPMEGLQSDIQFPTGTVQVNFDKNLTPDYYIVPDVAYDQIEPTLQLEELANEIDAICFGTLAQRTTRSQETLYWLINQLRPETLKIYDINLRKNCFNKLTVEKSLQYANVLKLSDEETRSVAEWFDLDPEDLLTMGKSLVQQWNLKCCLITLGARGALAFGENYDVIYQPGFEIKMSEPVGAGDAFTAGFIHRYLHGDHLRDCCKTGCGLGALVATQTGATEPVTPHTLGAFLESSPITQLDIRFSHLIHP